MPKASPVLKKPVQAAPKPSKPLKQTPQKTLAKDEEKITKSQPMSEQKASRPQIHGWNYLLSLFFISLSTYFLFIEPADLTEIVTQVDFLQGQLWCINIGLQAILGLSLLMLLYTVFRQFTQRKKASRDKPNEAILKTPPTSTPAVDQKKPEVTASKASATMPQKTQEAKASKTSATTTPQTEDTGARKG
ncbi:membrane protein [Beggiatoa sp. SS]|nr:membrane protein [Beggiatoa sp. SS]